MAHKVSEAIPLNGLCTMVSFVNFDMVWGPLVNATSDEPVPYVKLCETRVVSPLATLKGC